MIVTRVVAFAILFCSGYAWLQGQEITWSAVLFDGTVANLNDVAFLSDGTVVAVGDNAVVRVGDPSGPFPVVTGSFSEPHLRTVSIGANDLIVCAGDKGLVGFSPTKGQDWTFLQDQDWGDIRQVTAHRSKATALFASATGVYQSIDGGAFVNVRAGDATAVAFASGDTVYAGLADGSVLTSYDLGTTWNRHDAFSTTHKVVKMRYSRGRLFVIHERFVTFVNDIGAIDSTYVQAPISFPFTDIAVTDTRWFTTGGGFRNEHGYSIDKGRTWVLAQYGAEGGYAMALSATHIVAVGERGGHSYGPIDSCITTNFKFFGFRKTYERQWPSSHKYVSGNRDSLLVLTESPLFHLALITNAGTKVDTLFRNNSSIGNGAVAYLRVGSRRIILADTLRIETVGNTTYSYRSYVVYASNDAGFTWDTIVAPNKKLSLSNLIADNDSNIYFYGGTRYIYTMRAGSMAIDSIINAPIEYCSVLAIRGKTFVAIGGGGIARSTDQGSTWQTLTYTFAATPRHLAVGRSGRLVALESEAAGFVVQVSDDLGDTWRTTYSYTPPVGQTSIFSLRADSLGQCIATGFGDGVFYSLDNGETWKRVAAPVHNASALSSSMFVGPNEFVICSDTDELLRGIISPTSSVKPRQRDQNIDLDNVEIVLLELFDYLGRQLVFKEYAVARRFAEAFTECTALVHPPFVLCVARGADAKMYRELRAR